MMNSLRMQTRPDGLTNSKYRFLLMLERSSMKEIRKIWGSEQFYCHQTALKCFMNMCNPKERVMCQFYAMVWFGENDLEFDICKAIKELDEHNLAIVQNWVKNPFWA